MLSKLKKINLLEFHIRIFVIILAALTPIIIVLAQKDLVSLSSCWGSPIAPLFIISNAATSYYLFSLRDWKKPALLLLLLTAFSIDNYEIIHNILAILFFTFTLFSFFKTNHYKFLFWIYFMTIIIMPINMLLSEILSILVLCLYHGLLLHKVRKVRKEMKQIEEKL